MNQQVEALTSVLEDLVSDFHGQLAVVFTTHGDVLAAAHGAGDDGAASPGTAFVTSSLALMSAGLLGLVGRVGEVIDQGKLDVASLVYQGGVALVAPCGGDAGLALVAPPRDDLHALRHRVGAAAYDLGTRLTPQPR